MEPKYITLGEVVKKTMEGNRNSLYRWFTGTDVYGTQYYEGETIITEDIDCEIVEPKRIENQPPSI